MFSKALLKLIDSAIFPAIFIIAAKIIGITFLSSYFDTSYSVEGLSLVYTNAQDFIAVNSYSSLLMFSAVFAGLIWVVIKAHVFHDTHVKPGFAAQLLDMNMHSMVQGSRIIYSESFVWISYAWLCTLIFGVYSFYGLAYWWVFYLALGVSVIATAAIALDFEKEIKANIKPTFRYGGNDDLEISVGNKKLIKISEVSKEFI
ncbi:MAG: hypothetical protein QG570_133 [Patescibacteria group bacterium]|nr:hypothetical protein [Patescibacteria group bacterium]